MGVFGDFLRALGQIDDRAFRAVLLRGLGLTLLLLMAFYVGIVWLVGWLLPDSISLPWIGEIGFVDNLLSGASLLAAILLSSLLMVPVAAAFTGLFLDRIADAVEARHYPELSPTPGTPFLTGLADALRFLGVVVAANILALAAYAAFPPFAPAIFWAMNSFLLGREYFQLVALRRLPPDAAKALRRRHAGEVWLAGGLMAIPLAVPVVNLVVPILGAATFTHLFHRLAPAARRP